MSSDRLLSGDDALHAKRMCGGPRVPECVDQARSGRIGQLMEDAPEWLRGLGFVDDVPDVRDAGYPLRAVIGAADVPKSLDYTKYVDFVRDQLRTSSCVGWAVMRVSHVRAQLMGHRNAKHGSADFAYKIGRANAFTTPTQLTDDGSQPRNVIRGVKEWGIVAESDYPFDPETINDQPNWEQLEAGVGSLDYGVGKYLWVDGVGEAKFDAMKRALAAGYPMAFAIDVDETTMRWDSDKPIPGIPDDSDILGAHYVAAIGYTPDGIIIVNSWSPAWGDGGFAIISKERIAQDSTRAIVAIETAQVTL